MIKQRKNFVFTITLTLAILLVTILSPLSVQAAEVKVNTEQQLRNAINNASDGDVINVTGNITLKDGQLWVKHNKALTIRSGNNSVITAGDHYFLLLQNDANVTLAGNIRVESSAKSATIYVDKSTFTLNENAVINCKNTLYGIYSPEKSRVIISGGSINATEPNDSWGLKAQDNCEIFISSVAPRDTKISGGRSGITLVSTCLADITISKYVKITGGVHDQ